MNLKQLFTDKTAVSPVIGVILMVAITVILAAVIGTFVLGLGDNVQDSSPNANFQFDYTMDDADAEGNDDMIEVTHNGGENVGLSNVEVQVGGTTIYEDSGLVADADDDGTADLDSGSPATDWSDPISTGGSQVFNELDATGSADIISPGDDVRVIWNAPSGGTSNTIGSSQVP